jgi:hypothetical protein
MLTRALDSIFVKNIETAAAVTGSQTTASSTVVDLTAADPNMNPMCEQDISAVSGTSTSITDVLDGSNDNSTWTLAIASFPLNSNTVASRQMIDVPAYRYYRRGIGAFAGSATPSVTRSLKIIGLASARPVTQP